MASNGMLFAAPFDASEYGRKRAELGQVLETLLLLPLRHADAPPFASEYAALAAKRRALERELAALESEWA
jgi:hypothetical protein